MDTVTYPTKEVVEFINHYLIPLRVQINDQSIHEKYHTIWTPTIAVLDLTGYEVQKMIGFFAPDDLIATMHLGIAKVHMAAGEYDTAEVHFNSITTDFPGCTMIPEALFFQGVNLYKWKNDPGQLKTLYEKLLDTFPDNHWTQRAYPYRLI